MILLREKDLEDAAYLTYARACQKICEEKKKTLIIHHRLELCEKLGISHIHYPITEILEKEDPFGFLAEIKSKIPALQISASVHSLKEAVLADKLRLDFIIAGHIFETDCKKGLKGRGISFLKQICDQVEIPVYAIGGITEENIPLVLEAGAKGVCRMSSYMS